MSDRCPHGQMWHQVCNECPDPSRHSPISTEERLLAGSLAIAELAALRTKMTNFGEWLELQAEDAFLMSRTCKDGSDIALWRARGTTSHVSAQKLKELLGDAQ